MEFEDTAKRFNRTAYRVANQHNNRAVLDKIEQNIKKEKKAKVKQPAMA